MSKELIYKDDAIRLLAGLTMYEFDDDFFRKTSEEDLKSYIEWATGVFKTLPAIERKRGEWIAEMHNSHERVWKCSNCAFQVRLDLDLTPIDIGLKWCNNCGSDNRPRGDNNETD